ncbi:Alpha/beta hydrolase family-domain-containing protein [Chaetomium fimeti]|uniref:Alpha/beta hydrolase family-domain-containing protein n=1 Tax=Chaetomium fimeti TaxID=1854472 RepID=A0AAE0LVY2_9PEZI|nr:Alpha/beta hydrolase family-domain-containing protein [Chaetomium fimeti]
MSDPPTLVLIPGSWHQPTCYNKITKLLEEQHHLKCVSITLPSTTGDPNATFKDDLDAARSAITAETTAGRNVVVIAHSYGGMVGNSAIKNLTQRPPPGNKTGHVTGLILIASGFTLTGLTFMAPFLNRPPPTWRANTHTGFADLTVPPSTLFYHDLPATEAAHWASQLRPQSLRSLFEGGEHAYAGWRDLGPRGVWYVGTALDRGLPVVVQRMQVGAARAMGVRVEHRELRASHSPFLSRPEETVAVVVEAVEVFMGRAVPGSSVVGGGSGGKGEVVVPRVGLWEPGTWFRFGVPLVLGHVVGKCVLVFYWGRRLWTGR